MIRQSAVRSILDPNPVLFINVTPLPRFGPLFYCPLFYYLLAFAIFNEFWLEWVLATCRQFRFLNLVFYLLWKL